MKRISLALLMCILASFSLALITDYYSPPTASVGTYSAISGNYPAHSGQGWPPDEELTVAIPIGFTFNYCGTAITELKMSTDGFLDMGATHGFDAYYENILSSTSSFNYPYVAPLWDDLSGVNMSYLTTGSAPNRVFTAQWANTAWDYGGTEGQNFQVKLYETSNKIEFIYGPMINPTNPGASIGMNVGPGGAGNFYSITPGSTISYSTTVENSSISSIAYLTPGTTYTFEQAQASVPNPAVAVFPQPSSTSITVAGSLIWNTGGGLPTGYRLNFGTNGGGVTPPTNIVNNLDMGLSTSYTPVSNLSVNTVYYWQVVPYNAAGIATGCPIWSFTTGGLPLRGEKTIDPAGSGPDNYTSFTAAITDLNNAGVGQDGVVFNVPAGLTFNESNIPPLTTPGTMSNPITFMKSGTGANPLVTAQGLGGATDYVFKLEGGDYTTFDGIDVANAAGGTNIEYGYWLSESAMTGGSTNNVIKNCAITLDRSNPDTKGIYSAITDFNSNDNLFQNITINNAYHGIWLVGIDFQEDSNNVIEACTFNSIAEHSMHLEYQNGMSIFDNVVNYPTSEPCASILSGISAYGVNSSSVYNNTFSGGSLTRMVWSVLFNMSADIEIHHNTFTGTVTSGLYYIGIYFSLPRWGYINIHHNDIYDITSGMICWPIYTMRGYNININDNHIYDITTGSVFWGIHTIENMSLDSAANIYNNRIHDINLTADLMQMISCINVQDVYANIYNNMIYDIEAPLATMVPSMNDPQICGISVQDMQPTQGERAYIYNNSVLLNSVGSYNSKTTCFFSTFSGPVDLKNNIFVNHSNPGTEGIAATFWKRDASFDNFLASMDKNIYYAGTPGPRNLIYYDGTNSIQTLAAYKALNVGKDQGSYTEDVPFISAVAPYNLHINPSVGTVVEGNGIYLSSVVIDDIDGDIRSMTPDIGADEGDFTIYSSITSPTNITISKVGANIQISWTAVAGATGYKVYGSNDAYATIPWGTPLSTVLAPNTNVTFSPTSQYKFYYITAYQ